MLPRNLWRKRRLYQYIAPSQVPENNPVAISATIHTVNHGDIILIQPVQILGKWKLSFSVTNTVSCNGDGWNFKEAYSYSVNFHLGKDFNIIYDDNTYQPITVSNLGRCDACFKITSFSVDNFFVKASGMTGRYDPDSDSLYCKLSFTENPGVIHISGEDLCEQDTGEGYSLPIPDSHSDASLTLPLKNDFNMDTTIYISSGSKALNATTTINLKSVQ